MIHLCILIKTLDCLNANEANSEMPARCISVLKSQRQQGLGSLRCEDGSEAYRSFTVSAEGIATSCSLLCFYQQEQRHKWELLPQPSCAWTLVSDWAVVLRGTCQRPNSARAEQGKIKPV